MDTVAYRTTGAWGPSTGYDIPSADIDESFYATQQAIARMGTLPPVPTNGIADVHTSRTQLFVYLNDGTTQGPFDFPLPPFVWRGDWEPMESYSAYDVFGVEGEGIFFVLHDFVSDTEFDSSNEDIQQMFGPLTNEVTVRPITNLPDVDITLSMDICGWYIRNDTGCIFRVPTDGQAGWIDGANFILRQVGALPIQILANDGVTLLLPSGRLNTAVALEGSTIHLRRAANNTWDVWGDLALAETETET